MTLKAGGKKRNACYADTEISVVKETWTEDGPDYSQL